MIQTLREATRTARKAHYCGMCWRIIKVGDLHRVSTNVYDGRVYDWRECLPCHRDGVCALVHTWWGQPDEGVDVESARDWAEEVAVGWPYREGWRGQWTKRVTATERAAARAWLARVAGGEGE